ncbi:MAG TPA: TonB family protein [Pyrinomonadaceae bacterium]|nr:TonB family protein [Pyrinomonadaceae bacterium]
MFRMSNRLSYFALAMLLFAAPASAQTNATAKAGNAPAVNAAVESDRSRDGLIGPVRRVRTEVAKLVNTDGKQAEGKHTLVELAAYDVKGNKVENQYFPLAGATLTGKEVYKYDEKGNISEMTLLNPDGSLMSKETYKYEFDFLGNWNKMTTSVAVVDGRGITFEPTEITYRSIMYYLDENMLKTMSGTPAAAPQPAPPATGNPAANTAANTTAPVTKPADPKTKPVDPKANANKSRDNRNKPVLAPDLPEASATAAHLNVSPNDVKAPSQVITNQEVRVSLEEPPPAPRPILKPISGGVLNGTALSLPQPIYPEAAKRMRTGGTVAVEVILDESGKVVSATATSGPTILREAAIQAALKARFSPTKLSGQPVKVSGTINYKFALVP